MSKADAVARAKELGLSEEGTEEEILARVAQHEEAETIRESLNELLAVEAGADRVGTLLSQAYKIETVRDALNARRSANRVAVRNLYDTGILSDEEREYVDKIYPFTPRGAAAAATETAETPAENGNGAPAADPEPEPENVS